MHTLVPAKSDDYLLKDGTDGWVRIKGRGDSRLRLLLSEGYDNQTEVY